MRSHEAWPRRRLLAGIPLLALAVASARAATSYLSLACDTTIAPALGKAAAAYKARTGVQGFVVPTGPRLLVPPLPRGIPHDIVVTQTAILDEALQAGVIGEAVRAQWRNALVVAGLRTTAPVDRVFAAPDPSPASDVDGPALLARLGLKPARAMGAVDTDEVAF